MKTIITLLLATLLTGCISIASMDMRNLNTLAPVETTSEYVFYRFQSFADIIYRVDSEKAEHRRITDLERRLIVNGHDITKYKILKRQVIVNHGVIDDIFYDVRVSK